MDTNIHFQDHGLNLDATRQELADLCNTLSNYASRPASNDGRRVEQLLHATERIHSLLEPYFALSPNRPSAAQSLDISTVDFMIGILFRATEAYSILLKPTTPSDQTRTLSQLVYQRTPSTTGVSPRALSINSSMAAQPSPQLRPGRPSSFSGPVVRGITDLSSNNVLALSASTDESDSGTSAGVLELSVHGLPIPGPTILGHYISQQPELSRWVLATVMLFQMRSLTQLQKSMEASLRFYAPPSITQSLQELRSRTNSIKASIRRLIEMFDDEDE